MKPPLNTWILDCTNDECDGHMTLEEVAHATFSIEDDGPVEHSFQAWCCDTCDEWITDIDRESREIEAYKVH